MWSDFRQEAGAEVIMRIACESLKSRNMVKICQRNEKMFAKFVSMW